MTTSHPRLRAAGWTGYWIDAASTLRGRMTRVSSRSRESPRDRCGTLVRRSRLHRRELHRLSDDDGAGRLLQAGVIEWVTAMTYQAASGAGAQHMREPWPRWARPTPPPPCVAARDPASAILDIDRAVTDALRHDSFPVAQFGAPLAGSLIPWIDKDLGNGQSREE